MKLKTITICSSASFYKNTLEFSEKLTKLGYKVLVPKTALVMKRKKDFDVDKYKTWYKNPKDYKNKARLMNGHFKKIIKSDAILVINNKKNGMKGYIGGNGLMEITLAYYLKKPIFILNDISERLSFREEVLGVNPIFLSGKVENINS